MEKLKIFYHSEQPITIILPAIAKSEEVTLPDANLLHELTRAYITVLQNHVINQKSFPRNACISACAEVNANEWKLDMIYGMITLDFENKQHQMKIEEPHTWLTDENGIIYDMTVSQFNPGLINTLSPGVTIIFPYTDVYNRYQPFTQKQHQALFKAMYQVGWEYLGADD